jgi:Protein of unknown function (DUF1579)
MKRSFIAVLGLILVTSAAALAQMTTPAPELKKLDYFVGNWSTDATVVPGPWGEGGKFTDKVETEWMKGGFFQVRHSDFSMPPELGGAGTTLAILGYDAEKNTYTEERFDSMGRHAVLTGTLNADTWTWTGETKYGGMSIQSRLTIKMTSPTSYSSKYQVSIDGGTTWAPFWEGSATKK